MAVKRKQGRRPIKLTAEQKKRFLAAISVGAPLKDACGAAGVSNAWFFKRRNEAEEQPEKYKSFIEFLEDIKRAEGEATTRWLEQIEAAAMSGTWQAAAWKLERRRGMTLKVQQEISGPEGGPVKHEIADAKQRLLDKLAKLATDVDPE
jgi:hypothetical protein